MSAVGRGSAVDELWVALTTYGGDALGVLVRRYRKRFWQTAGAATLGVPSIGMVALLRTAGQLGLAPAVDSDRLLSDENARLLRNAERVVADQAHGVRRLYVDDVREIGNAAGLPESVVASLIRLIELESPADEPYCFSSLSIEHVIVRVRDEGRERPVAARALSAVTEGGGARNLRERPIFVQFVNPEFLLLHGQAGLMSDPRAVQRRLNSVARMALLASRAGLILPASYLFEVPGVENFFTEARELEMPGAIQLTAPASSLGEYRETKVAEYRDESTENPYLRLSPIGQLDTVAWRPRHGTTAAQSITKEWARAARPGAALAGVVKSIADRDGVTLRFAARRVGQVPERMDGRALVSRYVFNAIRGPLTPSDRQAVRWLLSTKYLDSYLADLDAVVLVNFAFGAFSTPRPQPGREISAARLLQVFKLLALEPILRGPFSNWAVLSAVREAVELDILMPALYGDLDGHREWWLATAAFRRRVRPPDALADPSGYIAWLGDLISHLASRESL